MFFVYILHSLSSQKSYIGCSDNLLRRFREHALNQEIATRHRGPWEMIYWEAFETLKEARGWEVYLKSGAGYRWRQQNGLIS